MKFNCERCNTKYSISDDRVRGKILKIRCKNCSDVITVRDPAGRADSANGSASRESQRLSTIADESESKRAPSPTAPPESLVAEWYVSEDGEQQGPFNLRDAKEWVSGKDTDADLYCWSEGFDDWLPVDKVSHFRGLRSPTQAPAIPKPQATANPTPPPKPLFAATMAALGDDSATVQDTEASSDVFASLLPASNSEIPAIPSVQPAKPITPLVPLAAAPSGDQALGIPGMFDTPATPGLSSAPAIPGLSSAPAIPGLSSAPAIPDMSEGSSIPALSGAPQVTESPGMLGAPAIAEAPKGPVFPEAPAQPDEFDFDIGEASRIVDLPALMAQGRGAMAPGVTPSGKPLPGTALPGTSSARTALPGTSQAPHLPGMAVPANGLSNGAAQNSVLSGAQPASSPGYPATIGVGTEPMATLGGDVVPPPPTNERRKRAGLLLPLLLLGTTLIVALVLFLVFSGDEEETGKRLTRGDVGGSNRLGLTTPDTRPTQDKPATPDKVVAKVDAGPQGTNPKVVRPRNPNNSRNNGNNTENSGTSSLPKNPRNNSGEVDLTGGNKPTGPTGPLDGDDLMRTYRKNQIALKMCYERSLKRDPLLKVPKTWVDVKVNLAGKVTNVSIKSLRGTDLGQCLVGRIGRWKFRQTTELFNGRFLVVFDK